MPVTSVISYNHKASEKNVDIIRKKKTIYSAPSTNNTKTAKEMSDAVCYDYKFRVCVCDSEQK